ncbi:hypothetical protein [Photobacterium phosphoreum]|uniref:hypothetical protein n=1 Tax=Photobacterium phosphoreum TaxID=659 RepID=UPI001E5DFE8F|nr:hypothetical protein [Photobacterium phosphoreum]MCD9481576.1 hypothetical protein [Photobacterium phosphoreum]
MTGESCVDDLIRILKDPVYRNLDVRIFEHRGGELSLLSQLEIELRNALKSGKKIDLVFNGKACSSAAAFYVYCCQLANNKYSKQLSIRTDSRLSGSFEFVFHRPRLPVALSCFNGQNLGGLLIQGTDVLIFRNDWNEPALKYLKNRYPELRTKLNNLARGKGDSVFYGRFVYALNHLKFTNSIPLTNQERHYVAKGNVVLHV